MTAIRALLLTPGAGSSREHPSLLAIEAALGAARPPVPVVRIDFPYRRAGRKAPDRAPVLIGCVRDEAAALAAAAGVAPGSIALGGRSMGGRMCSMAVAEGLPAAALILISYPLHPPGRPDQLRTAHLPAITVPCLFIHGTRDPFATPEELETHAAVIPGPVTHVWIDGKGHDLKGCEQRIATTVFDWVTSR